MKYFEAIDWKLWEMLKLMKAQFHKLNQRKKRRNNMLDVTQRQIWVTFPKRGYSVQDPAAKDDPHLQQVDGTMFVLE